MRNDSSAMSMAIKSEDRGTKQGQNATESNKTEKTLMHLKLDP